MRPAAMVRRSRYAWRFSSPPLSSSCAASRPSSGRKHDAATRLAVADLLQAFAPPFERIGRHHRRLQLAGFVEREQLREARDHLVRRLLAIVADLQAADLDILH